MTSVEIPEDFFRTEVVYLDRENVNTPWCRGQVWCGGQLLVEQDFYEWDYSVAQNFKVAYADDESEVRDEMKTVLGQLLHVLIDQAAKEVEKDA